MTKGIQFEYSILKTCRSSLLSVYEATQDEKLKEDIETFVKKLDTKIEEYKNLIEE